MAVLKGIENMPKYKVYVTILAHRDIGFIEAKDEKELNSKVRKENLAFEGMPDEHLDMMEFQVAEVRAYEI